MPFLSLLVFLLPNLAFLFTFLYLKYLIPPNSIESLTILARSFAKRCYCAPNKRQHKRGSSVQLLCLRIVFSIDPHRFEKSMASASRNSFSSSKRASKIKFTFCTAADRSLFRLTIMDSWLMDSSYANDVSLTNVFFPCTSDCVYLYRLTSKQYMLKVFYLLDNCVNFFDDLIPRSDHSSSSSSTYSSSKTRTSGRRSRRGSKKAVKRKRRKSRKSPNPDGVLNGLELDDYRPNPNRINKVFIQVSGGSSDDKGRSRSRRSSRRSSKRSRKFRSKDPLRSVTIDNFSVEMVGRPSDGVSDVSLERDLSLLETYFIATIYSALLTRLGQYYELSKCTLMPEYNRFYDKHLNYAKVHLTYRECVPFLHLSTNVLAMVSVVMIHVCGDNLVYGLLNYSCTAVGSCVVASGLQLLMMYLYKRWVRLWKELPVKKRKALKNYCTWLVLLIALALGFFTSLFIFTLSPDEQMQWLYSYTLSLVLFTITGLYIWYLVAIIFDYFEGFSQADLIDTSSNQKSFTSPPPSKYREAFERMMGDLVLNPSYDQDHLSRDM